MSTLTGPGSGPAPTPRPDGLRGPPPASRPPSRRPGPGCTGRPPPSSTARILARGALSWAYICAGSFLAWSITATLIPKP